MRKVLRFIDSVSGYLGELLKYFCFALVLIVTYDVIMRYVFKAPSVWAFETAVMVGGTIYMLSWAYTHLHKRHVRVDVIYSHLSPRVRAIIDVLGYLFLTFPLIAVLIAVSFLWAVDSWRTGEVMVETYWYPPFGPFRTMVFVAYCLFALQVMAEFVRSLYLLLRNKPYD